MLKCWAVVTGKSDEGLYTGNRGNNNIEGHNH